MIRPSVGGARSEDSVASKVPFASMDSGTSRTSAVVVDTSIVLTFEVSESVEAFDWLFPHPAPKAASSKAAIRIEDFFVIIDISASPKALLETIV